MKLDKKLLSARWVAAAASVSACLALSEAAALDLRVLVVQAPSVQVSVPLGEAGNRALWNVTRRGNELFVGGQSYGSELYWPGGRNTLVTIAGKTYRGGVYLRVGRNGIDGVNVVDIEDYLRGVVPAEMPASWHPQALQAQAIIARSYAVMHINTRGAHDVCATDRCQVYSGVAREHPLSDAAVRATESQVVSYGGRVAQTFFSSDSGGYTASSAETWGTALPYLQAKPDPASAGPHSSWRLDVSLAQAQARAASYRVNVGSLRSVRLGELSESGRPTEVHFQGSTGRAVLRGAQAGGFIRSLGAQSSRVELVPVQGGFVLRGSGNGHGVGLSQYGAKGLAELGYNSLQILGYYYAGAQLSWLEAGGGTGRLQASAPLPSLLAASPLPNTRLPNTELAHTKLAQKAPEPPPAPAFALLGSSEFFSPVLGSLARQGSHSKHSSAARLGL